MGRLLSISLVLSALCGCVSTGTGGSPDGRSMECPGGVLRYGKSFVSFESNQGEGWSYSGAELHAQRSDDNRYPWGHEVGDFVRYDEAKRRFLVTVSEGVVVHDDVSAEPLATVPGARYGFLLEQIAAEGRPPAPLCMLLAFEEVAYEPRPFDDWVRPEGTYYDYRLYDLKGNSIGPLVSGPPWPFGDEHIATVWPGTHHFVLIDPVSGTYVEEHGQPEQYYPFSEDCALKRKWTPAGFRWGLFHPVSGAELVSPVWQEAFVGLGAVYDEGKKLLGHALDENVALVEHPDRGWILIDTTGGAAKELEHFPSFEAASVRIVRKMNVLRARVLREREYAKLVALRKAKADATQRDNELSVDFAAAWDKGDFVGACAVASAHEWDFPDKHDKRHWKWVRLDLRATYKAVRAKQLTLGESLYDWRVLAQQLYGREADDESRGFVAWVQSVVDARLEASEAAYRARAAAEEARHQAWNDRWDRIQANARSERATRSAPRYDDSANRYRAQRDNDLFWMRMRAMDKRIENMRR